MTAAPAGINPQGVLSMRSGGYYSERTYGAKQAIDKMLPIVKEALAPKPGADGVLRVADFGAADGGTSRALWLEAFKALRDAGDRREISITYTDLPSNDYSTLFRTMQGLQGDPALAYQSLLDDVFVHACGTGFHRQLFPAASLDFGFSATSMHYLSEKPGEITTHCHATGAEGAEATAYADQARLDWERILLARAKELKPGARMVCLNFGIDEQGRYLGNTGGPHMFHLFDRFWREMRDEGAIMPEEYVRATFTQYYRTIEEFSAPFREGGVAPSAGLRLIDAFSVLTPCPYRARFINAAGEMSAVDFAKSLVPTLRSWSETVYLTALDARPPLEAQALVDAFYKRYEDHVAQDPTAHAMDYIHIAVVFEKSTNE